MKPSNTIPTSSLRQDTAKLLKQLPDDKKKILTLLAKGEREIEAGVGYNLDSVLAEADELLNKGSL